MIARADAVGLGVLALVAFVAEWLRVRWECKRWAQAERERLWNNHHQPEG